MSVLNPLLIGIGGGTGAGKTTDAGPRLQSCLSWGSIMQRELSPGGQGQIKERRWWRVKTVTIAGLLALATLFIAASPIPSLIARAWAVRSTPQKADAIVVLGGGTTWPGILLCGSLLRLQHGVWLYQRGYAPRVIVSGGADPSHSAVPAEAELMRQMAVLMGARPEDVVVEDRSSRTYENGLEVVKIMRREGWRSALLVTDAIHMRRARLVFERLGVRIHPTPSHTVGIGVTTPGQGLAILEQVGYEVIATAIYKLRGWA